MTTRTKWISAVTVCAVIVLVAVASLLPLVATVALFTVWIGTLLMVWELYAGRRNDD